MKTIFFIICFQSLRIPLSLDKKINTKEWQREKGKNLCRGQVGGRAWFIDIIIHSLSLVMVEGSGNSYWGTFLKLDSRTPDLLTQNNHV